jgi:hypothetical protein
MPSRFAAQEGKHVPRRFWMAFLHAGRDQNGCRTGKKIPQY